MKYKQNILNYLCDTLLKNEKAPKFLIIYKNLKMELIK